jgi:hypothetical protein
MCFQVMRNFNNRPMRNAFDLWIMRGKSIPRIFCVLLSTQEKAMFGPPDNVPDTLSIRNRIGGSETFGFWHSFIGQKGVPETKGISTCRSCSRNNWFQWAGRRSGPARPMVSALRKPLPKPYDFGNGFCTPETFCFWNSFRGTYSVPDP